MADEDVPCRLSGSKNSEETAHENFRIAASLSYVLVFLLIGVPVWWKTTEVYRVSLPYDQIKAFNDTQIAIRVDSAIAVCSDPITDLELQVLRDAVQAKTSGGTHQRAKLNVSFAWTVRSCTNEEFALVKSATTLSDLDHKLRDTKIITTFVLPSGSALLPPKDVPVHVGRHRALFVNSAKDLGTIGENVQSVVESGIADCMPLLQAYDRLAGATRQHSQPDKRSQTTLPSSTDVDVTFTLMLPEPSLAHVYWDIQGATSAYLKPFAKKLRDVVQLHVKSQVVYLKMLGISAHHNSGRNHYVLTSDKLPHIINPIESKLGSYVSTNPTLNFVVYVPPSYQTPLQIYDNQGEPSPLNAFLIPRWGGILLYNVNQSRGDTSMDMQRIMGVFLPQLRSLLGIPHESSTPRAIFSDLDSTLIRDWELDAIIRMRLVENILSSISTLQSLAQLLEEIGNIVIADHVGEQIHRATEKINEALVWLRSNDTTEAFRSSKDALIASEAAFFDKSMLALLYFPDNQKYGIYVPLFLPVSVPLVFSLVQIARWLKTKYKTKVEKLD